IRLWGVPRLFAAAVALALVASADPRSAVSVCRSRQAGVEGVDLTSREGIIRHLEALEPDPHPGAALRSWSDRLSSEEGATDAETFIVTHEDVLRDPEFMNALAAAGEREWHVATVSRDGHFALWVVGQRGRRELCAAELSL